MGINRVQFQKGLSMVEFMRRYRTQEKCHAAVVAQRWPDGFVCPECGESRHCTFECKGLTYWQCSACREQTTVLCGTVFESTKLPLTTWFLAMHLLTQAKNNVSALELKRHLSARKHPRPSETTCADAASAVFAQSAIASLVNSSFFRQTFSGWPVLVVCTAAMNDTLFSDPRPLLPPGSSPPR